MSEGDLDLVRRLYDAIGDRGPVAALDFAAPDVVLTLSPPFPRESYAGLEEAREFLAEWGATFGEYRIELEELIEARDLILVFARFRGAGIGGGVPVDIPVAHIWTLRDGQISQAHFFTDRGEALDAAGLPDPAREGS